ncbi:hypothetical protein [Oceanicella actignis]|uniref:hypothetical protein n=1 Tax=Oceanicella actignis TaxID=1189325 RepID=UPI0011E82C62|nr:hypothetical protein [Oceanicella actignis]TYO91453.1 hypothetical protein LY05_00306 [Oceanicella actignis]
MKITMRFEQAFARADDPARKSGAVLQDFDIQKAFKEVAGAAGHERWTGSHGEKTVQLIDWRDKNQVCFIAVGAFVPRKDTAVLAMDVDDSAPPGIEAFPPPQSKEFLQAHVAALLDRHNVLWCATRRGTAALLASLLFDMQQKLGVPPQKVTFKKPLAPDVVQEIKRHGVVSIDAKLAASRADIERGHGGGLAALGRMIFKPRAEGEDGDLRASVRLEVGKRGFSAQGKSDMLAREIAQDLLEQDQDDITFVLGNGKKYKSNQLWQSKSINVKENGDTFQILDAFNQLAQWRDELIKNGEIAK